MSENTSPSTRSFNCDSCRGEIQIPFELPPTKAPCPHCGAELMSPPPPSAVSAPPPSAPIKLTEEAEVRTPPPAAPAPAEISQIPGNTTPSPPPATPEVVEHSQTAGPIPTPVPAASGPDPKIGAGPGGPMAPERLEDIPTPPPSMAEPSDLDLEQPSRSGMHPVIPFLVAILLIVAVLVGVIVMKRGGADPDSPTVNAPTGERNEADRKRFLRDGWKLETTNTLTAFQRAKTLDQKAKQVIGGVARVEEMREFYDNQDEIEEGDTPLESFSHFDLDIADKERGLFLMRYERPAQYNMKEFFRPVAPLEVQHRLKEPGLLLSAFATRENFAMEPVRVMAFFKESGNQLLLDWDVYVQTKYRTLRHFNTYPQPGKSEVFRVMVEEDIAPTQGTDVSQVRYFRFRDPAHSQEDYIKIPVEVNSEVGQILSELAWIDVPEKQAETRYATVEMSWLPAQADEEPKIVLNKVICWEFLGLGGVEGNYAKATAGTGDPEVGDVVAPETTGGPAPTAPGVINLDPPGPLEPVATETPGNQ